MQINNTVKGLSAEYRNEDGRETVILTGTHLNFKGCSAGPATLRLSDVMVGAGGQAAGGWVWTPSFLERPAPKPAAYTLTRDEGCLQSLKVELPERYACTILFSRKSDYRMGVIGAPALFLDNGNPDLHSGIWIFALRSPDAAPAYLPERPSLSVSHDSGQATASFASGSGGTLEGHLSISGSSYHEAELLLRRSFMGVSLDVLIGRVQSDLAPFAWKLGGNAFNLISIFTPGTFGFGMAEKQFAEIFGDPAEFFSDGPGIQYSLLLKGHRRLFSDEDACNLAPVSG